MTFVLLLAVLIVLNVRAILWPIIRVYLRHNENQKKESQQEFSVRLQRTANGRFLRHRPERSERCLNYERLYQGQRALPKDEGVPQA